MEIYCSRLLYLCLISSKNSEQWTFWSSTISHLYHSIPFSLFCTFFYSANNLFRTRLYPRLILFLPIFFFNYTKYFRRELYYVQSERKEQNFGKNLSFLRRSRFKKKKQYQKTVLKVLNYFVNIKIQFSRNFYFLNESMELISYFDSLLHTKSLFDTIHRALTEIPTVKWHESCVKTSPISVLILSLV